MPSTSASMTSRPNSITTQCTGRTNCASPAPQRMRLAIGSASSDATTMPGQQVDGPGTGLGTAEHEPLALRRRHALERAHFDATATREGAGRLRRCAARRRRPPSPAGRVFRADGPAAVRPGGGRVPRDGVASRSVRPPGISVPPPRGPWRRRRQRQRTTPAAISAAVPRCRSRPGNHGRRSCQASRGETLFRQRRVHVGNRCHVHLFPVGNRSSGPYFPASGSRALRGSRSTPRRRRARGCEPAG